MRIQFSQNTSSVATFKHYLHPYDSVSTISLLQDEQIKDEEALLSDLNEDVIATPLFILKVSCFLRSIIWRFKHGTRSHWTYICEPIKTISKHRMNVNSLTNIKRKATRPVFNHRFLIKATFHDF